MLNSGTIVTGVKLLILMQRVFEVYASVVFIHYFSIMLYKIYNKC